MTPPPRLSEIQLLDLAFFSPTLDKLESLSSVWNELAGKDSRAFRNVFPAFGILELQLNSVQNLLMN